MQLLASDMCPKPGTQVSCLWVMGFMHDPLWGPPTREAKLGHWFLELRSQPAIVWQPVLSSRGRRQVDVTGGQGCGRLWKQEGHGSGRRRWGTQPRRTPRDPRPRRKGEVTRNGAQRQMLLTHTS